MNSYLTLANSSRDLADLHMCRNHHSILYDKFIMASNYITVLPTKGSVIADEPAWCATSHTSCYTQQVNEFFKDT